MVRDYELLVFEEIRQKMKQCLTGGKNDKM